MDKDDGALRTIGEVASETGIATHILRYWERHVPTLRPLRRAGGRRYYRKEDIALVRALHRLVAQEGFTLEGAARAMRAGSSLHEAAAPSVAHDDRGGAISLARLVALRDRLSAALER